MTATLHVEYQILAICLTQPGAIREVASIIQKSDTFSTEQNRRVYEVMLSLHNQSYETDLVSVNNDLEAKYGLLKNDPSGWIEFLTSLFPETESFTGNLAKSCFWLISEAMRRNLTNLYSRALSDLQIPGSDPLINMAAMQKHFEAISGRLSELSEIPFSASLREAVEIASQAAQSGDPITGIKTGLADYDLYTKGLHGQTLSIWAARPSMGKTAEMCQVAYNISHLNGIPSAIFSLEMSSLQMARRVLAIDSDMKNSEVTSGLDRDGQPIDISRLFDSAGRMSTSPIFVFDQIHSLDHIVAKITQLVTTQGVQVVFVDYIGLVETDDRDDRVRVSRASRRFKKLAKNLNIPIIALAQLSRKVEERANKRPNMADLRDSGALEQDADTIMFLYRPYYYSSVDEDGCAVDPNLLYNIIPKNRNGSTHNDKEAIELKYNMATNRIRSYRQF